MFFSIFFSLNTAVLGFSRHWKCPRTCNITIYTISTIIGGGGGEVVWAVYQRALNITFRLQLQNVYLQPSKPPTLPIAASIFPQEDGNDCWNHPLWNCGNTESQTFFNLRNFINLKLRNDSSILRTITEYLINPLELSDKIDDFLVCFYYERSKTILTQSTSTCATLTCEI